MGIVRFTKETVVLPFSFLPFSKLPRCRPLLGHVLCATALPLLLVAVGPVASAQDYPNRPIRFVVAQAPDIAGDALAKTYYTVLVTYRRVVKSLGIPLLD